MNPKEEAAWEAARRHGRAGVGRPRKDSPHPTLAQLGLTKWMARRALALAQITEAECNEVAVGQRGRSITSILERMSRVGRRRNPLFRAWRVAMQTERDEFIEALRRARSMAERAEALKDDKDGPSENRGDPVGDENY